MIDEVLTPDSSRFWPADDYQPGRNQPSFDKQFVREYLDATPWDKNSPPPSLPEEVVARNAREVHRSLPAAGRVDVSLVRRSGAQRIWFRPLAASRSGSDRSSSASAASWRLRCHATSSRPRAYRS